MLNRNKYVIPKWAYDYVCSVVRGQKEREVLLEGKITQRMYNTYNRFNNAVIEGLNVVCMPCDLPIMMEAIGHRVGYNDFPQYYGSQAKFFRMKRRCVYEIAVRLGVSNRIY